MDTSRPDVQAHMDAYNIRTPATPNAATMRASNEVDAPSRSTVEERDRAVLEEMRADIRLLKNVVSILLEQQARKDAADAAQEIPAMRHTRERTRRSLSPADFARRAAALERINTVMREMGDAAITEEDVAEYIAEQEALGLHHPLRRP